MTTRQTLAINIVSRQPRGTVRGGRKAFTLVEILVVLAITSVLLTLIFKPLVDSFNLTQRAGTQIESQASARLTLTELTSMLRNAVFIFDNKTPDTQINLWFGDNNSPANPVYETSRYAMVEAVMPSRTLDQSPQNIPIDPTTGLPMYGSAPSGQGGVAFPITSGRTLLRIFPGLAFNATTRDTHSLNSGNANDTRQDGMPARIYGNRYSDPTVNTNLDNRYLLYRAEVPTSIPDPSNAKAYIPNLKLFHTGPNGTGTVNTRTGALQLHDPNFFYDNSLAGDANDSPGDPAKWAVYGWKDLNGDGKVQIAENWAAVSSPIITPRKLDAVVLTRNDDGTTKYDSFNRPVARPLVTFSPGFVENDPGVPTALDASGSESPNPAAGTFTTRYLHWANPFSVSVFRDDVAGEDPLTRQSGGSPQLDYYQSTGNGQVLHYTSSPGSAPVLADPGDVGPHLIAPGVFDPTQIANIKFAFTVDPERGLVNFTFPASVMVHDSSANNYAPLGSFYDPAAINGGMNGTYNARYADLRTLPSALNPASAASPLGASLNWAGYVSITPGSERVYGPDQRPGAHYGSRILYTRVPSQTVPPGPNQYRINYQDVPNAGSASDANDPRVRIGYMEFDSTADNSPEDPINGQYHVHALPTLKFTGGSANSAADPIEIYYNFQMNRPNDLVKANYQTREMMNVSIEARLFDPASGSPQTTTLTERVAVRNLQH